MEILLDPDSAQFDLLAGYRYLGSVLDSDDPDPASLLDYAYKQMLIVDPSLEIAIHSDIAILPKLSMMLSRIASYGLYIDSRLSILRSLDHFFQTFMPLAIEKLCRANLLEQALEFLERARGMFWSQTLRLRTSLDEVPTEHRDRFSNLIKQLELTTGSFTQLNWNARDPIYNPHRSRTNAELEELVQQVRKVSGYERFLKPAPFTEILRKVGVKGTVVVVFAAADYCCALIVRSNVKLVNLHDINDGDVKNMAAVVAVASASARDDSAQSIPRSEMEEAYVPNTLDTQDQGHNAGGARAGRRVGQNEKLTNTLATMWRKVVKPVIDELCLEKKTGRDRDRPRLWWCPTGHFMFLPLHAAGVYAKSGMSWETLECSSDYMVSSYTPTLDALVDARDKFQPVPSASAKMLLAAVPIPFEGATLRGTVAEVKRISEVVPAELRIPLRSEDDTLTDSNAGASINAVYDNLRDATLFHLASHGVQNIINPLNSAFIMRDGKLTISNLMQLPQPQAFLAFLSACETAKGTKSQSNEAIHLAAAMLFVGFKSVVGTMWLMSDEDGPHVAETVYRQLLSNSQKVLDPDVVPYALDDAVYELRQKGLPPERWAPFVHFGI